MNDRCTVTASSVTTTDKVCEKTSSCVSAPILVLGTWLEKNPLDRTYRDANGYMEVWQQGGYAWVISIPSLHISISAPEKPKDHLPTVEKLVVEALKKKRDACNELLRKAGFQ